MLEFNLNEFDSLDGKVIYNKKDSMVRLHGEGLVFGQKFYGEQKRYTFILKQSFEMEDYFAIEYICSGLRRQLSINKPLIFALTDGEDIPLVCYENITMDNARHSVIVKTNRIKCNGIKIEFYIDRRFFADFDVCKLYTCGLDELPVACKKLNTDKALKYHTVDLEAYFNAKYKLADENVLIDGGRFFERESICLNGVPFKIKINENNIIAPSPAPKENDEEIMNFGVKAKRRICRPINRNSRTVVNVDSNAKEIFFIATLSGLRHQRWSFASDGTILGNFCGDIMMPLLANDAGQFAVEVEYENGNHDINVPYNMTTKKHGIIGDIGVYAIPTDGEKIKKIIFLNKMIDTECSIVALTLNETDKRLIPEMLIPEGKHTLIPTVSTKKNIDLCGNILSICNCGLTMKIDISEGLHLVEMKNEFIQDFSCKNDDILKIRTENGTIISKFELLEQKLSDDAIDLVYKYNDMELTARIGLENENDIIWNISVENKGNTSKRIGTMFPCISNIMHKTNEDGWYFFPKYQNINSNETVFIYEESAPSFPMQFFDVYSPESNGGLSITTRERECVVRKYFLEKNENGISFFVEYPLMYGEIKPNECFKGSETVLTAHSGNWKKSFEIYKSWLDSWYEPYFCQDKKWYRKCFWLLAEITDFMETEEHVKFPVWYHDDKFHFFEILEEQKDITGVYPDILHLWNWTYKIDENGKQVAMWGNYGGKDYDNYGGVDNFRNALHEVMDKKDIKMSLYLHPTLLSAGYERADKFFPTHKVVNDIGENITFDGDSYRMCHANETWRQEIIKVYQKLYSDLKVPILYVDEFSLRIENRCYSENHGHDVPSNLLKTDRDFISELKAAMPKEVVLYGEYAAVDINARYIDCNISYYILDSIVDMIETAWRGNDGDDTLGRVITNMYRFAFPKIVQLILPMAMRNISWLPQKFIFFNGEAIYDSFWDTEISDCQEFTVKAYKLKKKYADCFASDTPETMIDTLSPAICVNKFPEENHCVYTIYNRAYTTFRGAALKIEHKDGNVYYDAWNEKELKVNIKDGYAEVILDMGAQEIGCIEVIFNALQK